ncbi:MAG: rhomboid family intramembrane serine protease [Thermoleophilia bacterium]|nr:rhomboid family intramembrane serine protease [Thermoleophilia bacterium]MDH5333903.1 rhomboid family intramembrane serine protease [Thermoleophilia bacterium]
MLPLGNLERPPRFPWVTLALIGANLLVWLAYELQVGLEEAVETLGFRPCEMNGSCAAEGQPWVVDGLTAMFAHGGWSHVVGNLVFLAALGPVVEGLAGHVRFALLYVLSGMAADALQGGLTLAFAAGDADIPNIGASGAISGVIAAFVVARPFDRILAWVMPCFFVRIPAIAMLGVWFVIQALEGTYTLSHPESVVGIAFFAHVGGFAAGVVLATMFLRDAWTRHLRPGSLRAVPRGR